MNTKAIHFHRNAFCFSLKFFPLEGVWSFLYNPKALMTSPVFGSLQKSKKWREKKEKKRSMSCLYNQNDKVSETIHDSSTLSLSTVRRLPYGAKSSPDPLRNQLRPTIAPRGPFSRTDRDTALARQAT